MVKLSQRARKQRPGIKTVLTAETLTEMFLASAVSTLPNPGLIPSKYPGLLGVECAKQSSYW